MKKILLVICLILLLIVLSFSVVSAYPDTTAQITASPECPLGEVSIVVPFSLEYTQSYICTRDGTIHFCGDNALQTSIGEVYINGKVYIYTAKIELKEKGK